MIRPFIRFFPLIWFALLAAYVYGGVSLAPLHGDEPTQIYMGRDFFDQFVNHDLASVMYREWSTLSGEEATRQDLRLLNGTTIKYLFGFAAWSAGYQVTDINQQWSWGSGWDWNHANGHVPSDDLLLRSRLVSATLFALGIPVLFIIGKIISGQVTAYAFSLLVAVHPALLLNGRRAMMEGGLTFFSLLTVLTGMLVIRQHKWWTYALLGFASGLTIATKHTGVVTVAAVFVACGLQILWHRQQIVRNLLTLSLAAGLALVTFYALNPAWWSNPAQRLSDVLQARSALLRDQTQTYGSYPDFGAQVAGFFRQTFTDSIMIAEVPVDDFIPRQQDRIQYYQQSGLAGWHPGTILLPVLSAVGLLHLWQRRCRESAVILCWLLATIVLTLFLTPLEWQRYYLPIYPVTLLTAAGGLSAIIGWIGQYSVQRDRKVENNG